MDKLNPFPDLKTDDWSFLDAFTSRQQCPSCDKSRKYFCYTCNIVLPHIAERVPQVKLPVKVDIIKHPSEIDGKSTATHAAILAPEDVNIYVYPAIPDYEREKIVIVFPGKGSVSLEDMIVDKRDINRSSNDFHTEKSIGSGTPSPEYRANESKSKDISDNLSCLPCNSSFQEMMASHDPSKRTRSSLSVSKDISNDDFEKVCGHGNENISTMRKTKRKLHWDIASSSQKFLDPSNIPQKMQKVIDHGLKLPFQRVIFIDSTWNQTRNIINDERLKGLQRVELKTRLSKFWRKQQGIPDTYLSTIEAIYYFMKDLHVNFINVNYDHEYDNLLFFFCFMYEKIVNSCRGQKTCLKP